MEKDTRINELNITEEEFQALMKCPPNIRYQYTLKRIADTEIIWTLINDNNSIVIQNSGVDRFLSIWSSKEYAQFVCIKDWANYKSMPISLDYFENHLIDYICEENLLINVFPTEPDSIGKIVGLNTFAEDLSEALEDYD